MAHTPTLLPCASPIGPIPRVSSWAAQGPAGGPGIAGPEASPLHPLGLVLVTDAVPALGLGNGRHTLGQQEVEVDGLTAYVAGA